MTTNIRITIAVLAAGLIASGCVSTGTFEKMQTAKDEEIKTLQQKNTVLEQQAADFAKQRFDLEQQREILARQKSGLIEQNTAIQKQVGSLEQQKQQYDALVKSLSSEVENGQLQVKQYQNMLSVDLAEKIFFDSGKAILKPGGKEVLKKVGEALKGYENKIIRVVGHTDNVPIAKALQSTFPTNWELSVERAATVVRFLQDAGIPPERMVASGRGEYDPVATNDTPDGRQKNRRIEIMIIDQSLVDAIEKSSN